MTVNGKPAPQARRDRDYGMVFQAPILFDWRSVQGNVELPLEINGTPKAERGRRAAEHLALVELSDFAGHYPWQLSGGMQQRVAIARALALDPAILLMDEPFGALDEMTRERMNMELLKIWDRTRTTVLFVTHSIAEAVFLSTRVVVMSARPGRIAAVVDIDLPRERTAETRETEAYFHLVTVVREALRGDEASATRGSIRQPAGRRRGPVGVTGVGATARGRPRVAATASGAGFATGGRRPCSWSGCSSSGRSPSRRSTSSSSSCPARSPSPSPGRRTCPSSSTRPSYTFLEIIGGMVIGCDGRDRRRGDHRSLSVDAGLADAVRGRGQLGADPRLRAAVQQLVRAGPAAVEGDDRGGPVLLPGDDQHGPRADDRRSGGRRAPALVRPRRRRRCSASCACPNALPYVFTALRLAATLATIGAVVGEYFAAPRASLGQYIATYSAFLNFERSWAAIVFACAIGIGLYVLVAIVEWLVMPWARSRREWS